MKETNQNKLKDETSPYLLQHKNNPVLWYPWGEEAFQKARGENKPIFLSIGYSTCHWCHVMAHESFEDTETANIMNELFINIKVDREERPDVDEVYLEAVMLLNKQGGWPLSVFLTPQLKPFYGGTYFPLEAKNNLPSFKDVLKAISNYYNENASETEARAEKIIHYLKEITKQSSLLSLEEKMLDKSLNLDKLVSHCLPFFNKLLENLENDFDHTNGGFNAVPKFPQPSKLEALLHSKNAHHKSFAIFTLNNIRCGGIIDQIGGGISRYSVDSKWHIPHFEKMLYDNAQMLNLFSVAGQQLKKNNSYLANVFFKVADDILGYLDRELKCKKSGLYFSAENADSEGEEGAFYTFFSDEFSEMFYDNPELKYFAEKYFKIIDNGNFEGKNILTIPNDFLKFCKENGFNISEAEISLKLIKEIIYNNRIKKEKPSIDNKCLLSWNSLLCTSLIKSSISSNNFTFLEEGLSLLKNIIKCFKNQNNYFHVYIDKHLNVNAFLDDLSFLLEACVETLFITGAKCLLIEILEIIKLIHTHFVDPQEGLLYFSRIDTNIINRPCKPEDNVIYSSNSALFGSLSKLSLWISINKPNDISSSEQKMIDSLAFLAISNTVLLAEKIPTACAKMLQKVKFLENKNVLLVKNCNETIPLPQISLSNDHMFEKLNDFFIIILEANDKFNLSELDLYTLDNRSNMLNVEYSFCNIKGCKTPQKDIADIFN